jgi:hypothetical protein
MEQLSKEKEEELAKELFALTIKWIKDEKMPMPHYVSMLAGGAYGLTYQSIGNKEMSGNIFRSIVQTEMDRCHQIFEDLKGPLPTN